MDNRRNSENLRASFIKGKESRNSVGSFLKYQNSNISKLQKSSIQSSNMSLGQRNPSQFANRINQFKDDLTKLFPGQSDGKTSDESFLFGRGPPA
jgi:hypothetical protein